MAKRKPVCGVGINDADYTVDKKFKNDPSKRVTCPYYARWYSMLLRCYTEKHPSYAETFVCDEWLLFSNFRKWMVEQDWRGLQIDKDLLGDGSVYSPNTCTFIPQHVNKFMISALPKRLRQGGDISFCKRDKVYRVNCNDPLNPSISVNKSSCNTEEEAVASWLKYKYRYAIALAATLEDRKLAELLIAKYRPSEESETKVSKTIMRKLLQVRRYITDPSGRYDILLLELGAAEEDI